MKKLSQFTLGLAILLIGLFIILFGFNYEEDNPESSISIDTVEPVETIVEVSETLPDIHTEYEAEGKKCKSIGSPKERGDCFQVVNSSYLKWQLDESRGYGSDDTEEKERKDLLFYTIEDSDRLGEEVQKTSFYDEYLEIRSLDSNSREGEKTIQEYWHIFSNIFPQAYRKNLKLITWTEMDYVFQVRRNENNIKQTVLSVSSSPFAKFYRPESKAILIHEFAHILTLSEEQVQVDKESYAIFVADDERLAAAKADCPTYFSFGCMKETSYMYSYYQQFWEDIIADHTVETVDEFKSFFLQYEDRFFNTYMATHPLEDIAEAFTFFVMLNSDDLEEQSGMKYDKVKFFYNYDELVELRAVILENIYDLSVGDREFY